MAREIDTTIETLVQIAPEEWARWVTGIDDLIVRDILEVPYSFFKSDREILIQVKSPRRGQFIVLNRWQLYYNDDIPNRISASAAMAANEFRLPIYPVLINILRPSRGTVISNSFESECLGLKTQQDCQTINLWDVDAEVAFNLQRYFLPQRLNNRDSLTPLLPFVPIMKGGDDESVLKRAATILKAENGFEELLELLATFGTFALGVDLVERVMKLQTEALRASPMATTLKLEGQQEGSLQMLMVLVESKFGHVPNSLQVILPSLSAKELQELGKRLLQANSLKELIASIYKTS